jgi:SAM-dependent methyltransferase
VKFESCARSYERNARAQRQVAAWCAEWIEQELGHHRAVEFGAGTGLFTRHLVAMGARSLYATDKSRAMVEQGRRNVSGPTWLEMDAFDPDGAGFDRLYSCSLLQWLSPGDHACVLKRWRALIGPGGRALVALFIEGSLAEFEALEPRFSAFRWQSSEYWWVAFEQAGFRVLRSSELDIAQRYPGAVAALRGIHSTGAISPGRLTVAQLRHLVRSYGSVGGEARVSWRAARFELGTSLSSPG